MTRVRISTTVDADLLAEARRLVGKKDAEVMDEALRDLVRQGIRSRFCSISPQRHADQAKGQQHSNVGAKARETEHG